MAIEAAVAVADHHERESADTGDGEQHAGLAPRTPDDTQVEHKQKKRSSSVVRPPSGGDSLLEDLQKIKALYANNHLSDVLFVFASEKRTTSHDSPAADSARDAEKTCGSVDDADAPEQHLLPAHRLVLALRSGTFQSALLRTKSSQVPSQVRFPLKIHIQDTPYRVFAALIRFLYTNEVADTHASAIENGASRAKLREREEFWKELLRASFIYLVPALLEICEKQIVQMLSGGEAGDGDATEGSSEGEKNGERLEWKPELLRKVLDVLVFTDSVLAAKHPAVVTRRVSKKVHPVTPDSSSLPVSSTAKENGILDLTEHEEEDLGFARCLSSIIQLQHLCISKLKAVSDRQFEALVHTEVGRRCTTERLCDILKQRSDTPLVVAIRYQLGRVVNELLKRGEPIDQFFKDESDLPLVAALKTGNDAIIRRLLVDEDAPYFLLTDKIPLFFLACGSGNVQHCQILIEQNNAHVNMISQLEDGDKEIVAEFGRGQTPLHIASRKGHSKVVELLLNNNAVSNLQDEEGNTALHCAGNMETAEILLSSSFKTNPNIPNRRGQTPLHVAAAKGNVGIVDLLIRSGCQQDIVDDQGQTAFHVAAANGHTSVALILLRENESFERAQSHRKKAEKLSVASGEVAGEEDAQSGTTDDNASDSMPHFVVNQEDLKGNTALHLAAMSPSERCQKMIQLLLENGADPNHTNWFGYTPLHLFCSHQSGPDSVIDVFVSVEPSFDVYGVKVYPLFTDFMVVILMMGSQIEHGVNIRVQSLDGSTALHLAVGRASESVAIALVIAGAHVHLQDAAGRSIVDLAETTNQGAMLVPVLRNLAHPPDWVADDQSKECSSCHTAFRVAMRKHHCRHCGRIVCYNCSSNKIPIPKFQVMKPTRVCDTCYDVLSFRRLL